MKGVMSYIDPVASCSERNWAVSFTLSLALLSKHQITFDRILSFLALIASPSTLRLAIRFDANVSNGISPIFVNDTAYCPCCRTAPERADTALGR